MSVKKSLYARYVDEKYGLDTFETDFGFITYKCTDTVCHVETLYVVPEARRQGAGTRLMDLVRRELPDSVRFLSCEIDTGARDGEKSFLAVQSYGFEVLKTQGTQIIMVKYL